MIIIFDAEAHHIIPDEAMRNNPLLRHAHEQMIFDFDSADNGIFLPNSAEGVAAAAAHHGRDVPYHRGSHHQYSQAVQDFADREMNRILLEEGVDSVDDLSEAAIEEAIENIADEAERLLFSGTYIDEAGRLR